VLSRSDNIITIYYVLKAYNRHRFLKLKDEVRSRLDQLNTEFHALENLIGKGKSQAIDDDIRDDESEEAIVHCVTCGVDIHCKTAIKHMERCYNKVNEAEFFSKCISWIVLLPHCN
jgi:hypothetical protein